MFETIICVLTSNVEMFEFRCKYSISQCVTTYIIVDERHCDIDKIRTIAMKYIDDFELISSKEINKFYKINEIKDDYYLNYFKDIYILEKYNKNIISLDDDIILTNNILNYVDNNYDLIYTKGLTHIGKKQFEDYMQYISEDFRNALANFFTNCRLNGGIYYISKNCKNTYKNNVLNISKILYQKNYKKTNLRTTDERLLITLMLSHTFKFEKMQNLITDSMVSSIDDIKKIIEKKENPHFMGIKIKERIRGGMNENL